MADPHVTITGNLTDNPDTANDAARQPLSRSDR